MDWQSFLEPLPQELTEVFSENNLGSYSRVYIEGFDFPSWQDARCILLSCEAYDDAQEGNATLTLRRYFYSLAPITTQNTVVDLGNVQITYDLSQTIALLQMILESLLEPGRLVVVLGGSQALTLAQMRAMQAQEMPIYYASVDKQLDALNANKICRRNFNHHIFSEFLDYLTHFVLIGAQQHWLTIAEEQVFHHFHFERVHLAQLQKNIYSAEVALRNAHVLSVDFGCLRKSDASEVYESSVVGLTTEALCQIARFAGWAPEIQSVGFYGWLPNAQGATMESAALTLWYLLQGFLFKPAIKSKEEMRCYRVMLKDHPVEELVFYEDVTYQRWWIELPNGAIIPCTYEAFEQAKQNQIPERWWLFYMKQKAIL